jgi:hypothetical protein
MLDPYGLPFGHRALCPCDDCQAARGCWASRQPPLVDGLPLADAEDSTDTKSIHEELKDVAFRR